MSDVIEYLRGRGEVFTVLPCPEALTPEQTARHHGVSLTRLIRTSVVDCRTGRALMAVPASHDLEPALACDALGDPEARPTSLLELDLHFTGYDPHAWPPLGYHLGLPLYLDPAVAALDEVVFPVGEPTALIRIEARQLFRGDPVLVVPLTRVSKALEPVRSPNPDPRTILPVHLADAQERAASGM